MKYSDDSTADHSYMCTSNDFLYEKMRSEVLPSYRDKEATPIKLACIRMSYLVMVRNKDYLISNQFVPRGYVICLKILSRSFDIVS